MAILRFIPAAVLAYAAGSKLWNSALTLDLGLLSAGEMFALVVLPLIEFSIASALVLFCSPAVISLTFCLFSGYAGYLMQLLWIGETNCDCLGGVTSDARRMLAADFLCLAVLFVGSASTQLCRSGFHAVCFVCLPFLAGLLWTLNPSASSRLRGWMDAGPLAVRLSRAESIPMSSDYRGTFEIVNRTHQPIQIASIMASCGCTSVEPASFSLQPAERRHLRLEVDLTQFYTERGQQRAEHLVTAKFLNEQNLPVDELMIFSGSSFRTFSVSTDSLIYHWDDSLERNSVTLSLRRFTRPEQPLHIYLNDSFVASCHSDIFDVAFARPQSAYEHQTIRIADPNDSRCSAQLLFSIQTTPVPLSIVFDDSGRTLIADSAGEQWHPVDATAWDDAGSKSCLITLGHSDDRLLLNEPLLKRSGKSYLDVTVRGADGFSRRLVYPITTGHAGL